MGKALKSKIANLLLGKMQNVVFKEVGVYFFLSQHSLCMSPRTSTYTYMDTHKKYFSNVLPLQ